jgi:Tol biopolymer transport system component
MVARARALLATGGALVLAITLGVQSAGANFPSRNDQIVFTSTRDGSGVWRLYKMDADGTNQTRVTTNNATEEFPVPSPDGSKIAFAAKLDGSGYEHVYKMDASGQNTTLLTQGGNNLDYQPAWSPDGSKIAYAEWSGGSNYDMLKMDANGQNKTVLINTSAVEDRPAWSPGGSKIVFETNTNGNYDIYKMDAGGQNVTRLTTSSADDKFPSFSPDGSKIVFGSNRDGNFEIYKMDADGSNQTRVTNNSATDYLPRYSPLGNRIVFARTISGFDQIFSMDPNGSNVTQLTNSVRTNTQPAWGPDTQAPSLSIDSGPSGPTNNVRPTFSFSSDDSTATLACSIDTGTPNFGSCSGASSHQSASDLADGDYTFRVKATDASGNSTTPSRSFTIDTQPPSVSVDPDPGDFDPSTTTTNARPTFHFSTGNGSDTFQCSIDTGIANFGPCSGQGVHRPDSGLSDGDYSFRVKATDTAGNSEIGVRTFSVRPDTFITFGPNGPTNIAAPVFTYASTVSGSSFECRVDTTPFAACSSSGYASPALADGFHTFSVRAIGPQGHTDQTPATQAFTVDTVAPSLSFQYGPTGAINAARPTFGFSTDDETATASCKLNDGDYAPCTTNKTYQPESALGNGDYTLAVRMTDPAGNESTATRSFAVETSSLLDASTYVYQDDGPPEASNTPGDLWVSRNGQPASLLPIWGDEPSLSPDGRRIAFTDSAVGGLGYFITDTGGHSVQQIGASPGWIPQRPQWEPDGRGLIVAGCGPCSDGYTDIIEVRRDGDTWTKSTLINWPGGQGDPVMSPDGSKIAFYSTTDQFGNSVAPCCWSLSALFVADSDGSHPVQLTTPQAEPSRPDSFTTWNSFGSNPTFSPDGKSIALAGWGATSGEDDSAEIWSIDVSTGAQNRLTHDNNDEYYASWLPDGRLMYKVQDDWRNDATYDAWYQSVNSDGTHVTDLTDPVDGNHRWIGPISGALPASPTELTADSQGAANQLLDSYAPTLKYDDGESFRAIDPAPALSTYSGDSADDSNRLVRGDDLTLAYANPNLTDPNVGGSYPLSLSFLNGPAGEPYLNGIGASEADHIVERTSTYGDFTRELDSAAIQSDPANEVSFGRAIHEAGRWWLQYWFYYYNDPGTLGVEAHEGDWEMIQVGLDRYGQPGAATYAEHSTGQSCAWTALNWTLGHYANVSPMVYVAINKHASYVRPGTALGPFPYTDVADGDGWTAHARVQHVDGSEGWILWPGHWGNTGFWGGASPQGPMFHSEWDQPTEFADNASDCQDVPETGTSTARPVTRSRSTEQRPPKPHIAAHRRARQLIVRYRWPRHARPRPKGLRLSVAAKKRIVTPISKDYRRTRRHGAVEIPLPAGHGPYELIAQTVTKTQRVSRETRVKVGGKGRRPADRATKPSGWAPPAIRVTARSRPGTFTQAGDALATFPEKALAIARFHDGGSARWRRMRVIAQQESVAMAATRALRDAPAPRRGSH